MFTPKPLTITLLTGAALTMGAVTLAAKSILPIVGLDDGFIFEEDELL